MHITKETYLKAAKKIEAKLKVPVCIIKKNPTSVFPMSTTGDGYMLFVIAKEERDSSTLKKARDIAKYLGVQQTLPVSDFVEMAKRDRRVIRNSMGGMGLISPFFFHEEVYGNYAKSFKKAVKKEFQKELNEGLKDWLAKFGIHSEKEYKARISLLKRMREIDKKVVGPREQKYLQKELARMSEEIRAKNPQIIIFFERASRYLAEPLKKIMSQTTPNRKPKVFFVDPTIVRNAENEFTFGTGTKVNYSEVKQLFEKEFPLLARSIAGRRVMLVDDQSCSENSKKGMERLISQYNPKTLNYTHLSTLDTAPEPSWRRQEIYSVESKGQSFKMRRAKIDAAMRRRIRGLKSNLNRVADRVIKGKGKAKLAH